MYPAWFHERVVLRSTKPVPKARRRWVDGTLAGARFHNVDLTGTRFTGVIVDDVEIDGLLLGLKVNGVDVVPLVLAELDRRHPELVLIRSDDPAELREGWSVIRRQWDATTEAALRLPPERLTEEVDDEWSFVDTMRHLVFVTDAWVSRTVRRDPHPYWPAGLGATDTPVWFVLSAGLDATAAPSLTDVLAARAERVATLTEVLAEVTAEDLTARCRRARTPGYPADPSRYTVGQCLRTALSEEWAHHSFAARDLAVIVSPRRR